MIQWQEHNNGTTTELTLTTKIQLLTIFVNNLVRLNVSVIVGQWNRYLVPHIVFLGVFYLGCIYYLQINSSSINAFSYSVTGYAHPSGCGLIMDYRLEDWVATICLKL